MNQQGKRGEEVAVRALLEDGYRILAVNYHSRYGEVDIIAQDGETVCFIEVKTRRQNAQVGPEQAVSPAKQRKIIQTALLYMQDNGCELQPRFDLFAVTTRNGEVVDCSHLKGAFDGGAYHPNY